MCVVPQWFSSCVLTKLPVDVFVLPENGKQGHAPATDSLLATALFISTFVAFLFRLSSSSSVQEESLLYILLLPLFTHFADPFPPLMRIHEADCCGRLCFPPKAENKDVHKNRVTRSWQCTDASFPLTRFPSLIYYFLKKDLFVVGLLFGRGPIACVP